VAERRHVPLRFRCSGADLVVADTTARAAAVSRFHETEDAIWAIRGRMSEVWAEAKYVQPLKLRFRTELDRLQEDLRRTYGRSLMHVVTDGWLDAVEGGVLVHFSLRYLEWEARYPAEWAKHWGIKRGLLWKLSREPMCAAHRRQAADLVVLAVERPQRCEDDQYVRLARAIADDELRARLAGVATERAEFMLHMLDHPDRPPTRHSWQTWASARVHSGPVPSA